VTAVLPVVDLRGSDRDPAGLLPRAPAEAVEAARAGVRELVEDVAARGDAAVGDAARRFDGVDADPDGWRVTVGELAAAEAGLDRDLRAALLDATARARAFHRAQRPADLVWSDRSGVRLEQRFVPLRRVGVYAPGGLAAYPSRGIYARKTSKSLERGVFTRRSVRRVREGGPRGKSCCGHWQTVSSMR